MLDEFATWYGRQMASLLPTLTARGSETPDGLVVDADTIRSEPQSLRLSLRRRGRETALGRFVLDAAGAAAVRAALPQRLPGPVVLRLPPGALLERAVVLPLAAESSLDRVVEYEMDRFTPFGAEEVFWTAAVRGRDRVQGRLQAAITLIPRLGVAPVIEALRAISLRPAALEGEVAGGAVRRVPLSHRVDAKARRSRLLTIAAAAGCAALALVAIALPFLQQWRASDSVETRIAALQPEVAQAEALRRKLTDAAAGSDAIASEQQQVGKPLETIAALTQILPDDTYLTALVLSKRQVTIEGQSANAARLIGSLSADPLIRNAAFGAPVTRNDTGADLFSIKAEVRP